MTDFMITMFTLYPWFAWLVVVLALAGLAWWGVWLAGLSALAADWVAYRRAVLGWKTAVRRVGDDGDRLCPMHALEAERATGTDHLLEDDPPEYQHPDGDDDLLPEPDEDKVLAFLATVKAMGLLDEEEERPAGWLGNRCTNRDCYRYGEDHGGACDVAPTMPAACYLEGPAMPPQPVREFLHPAIMDSLEAAGFSRHETTEGAVDSMFTRAQAAEVQAMITDGVVIPTDETGRSH